MEAVRRRITCRLERIVMLRRIRLCRERLADRADGGELHAGQFPALEYIIRHDGCAQKELAAQFHVTPASVALTTKPVSYTHLDVYKRQPGDSALAKTYLKPKQKEEM